MLLLCSTAPVAFAQVTQSTKLPVDNTNHMRDTVPVTKPLTDDQMLDSLRKKENSKKDSVIFNSKFIKVTNERLLNDSTQVFPLDTGLTNYENYSPLYQPRSPKIGLGNLGLAERNLLFEPSKTIGFDVGQHFLDAYLLHPEDIQYYRARVPWTSLYLVSGGQIEQMFKLVHTQNIKPNWNVGLNYNKYGSDGLYARQKPDHLNAAFFSWYESPNKRYNILGNLFFNNLKSPENGSITSDTVFTGTGGLSSTGIPIRLNNSRDNLSDNGLYLKQFYYLGRVDTVGGAGTSKVLPTQRIAYTLFYNIRKYRFLQDDLDTYHVFPDFYYDKGVSRDSLALMHISNEFSYSFYLRGKSLKFVKNEAKLDLGIKHDYYSYSQYVRDTLTTPNQPQTGLPQMDQKQAKSFQDITLKAKISYRFSDRMGLDADFQQIAQGRDFGDYLYEAKLNVSAGDKIGKIILGAYTQNSSPPLDYTNWITNHYRWVITNFKNVKTTNLSFNYINNKLQFDVKAEYFLIDNYLYFEAEQGGIDAYPTQLGAPINLLKISVSKNIILGRWHFDNFAVYQKTDYQNTLRTPELYIYTSLYYNKLFFNVLNSSIGLNVRYNTPYAAPSYAVGLGEFYNGSAVKFSSYPVATAFIKATLKRTNLFLMYDYANQGLFSNGYYTVNRYPMPSAILKFGVLWSFYD
ncbi:putative beta-barrel porin [Mucilaginibacter gracilis]|uniref:Putative beta-barrel porin n=1 Tax=Mucilaginibacter gracilis TaxID=423350 RepID=A0A495IUI2_9SPHI|nr:putative beta-barrel porin [Mucilaginibacter gracilis]